MTFSYDEVRLLVYLWWCFVELFFFYLLSGSVGLSSLLKGGFSCWCLAVLEFFGGSVMRQGYAWV
jgi:hypothetical protein